MESNLSDEYRPSEDEPYMNPRQLEYFRKKLLEWRDELVAESKETLEHLREEPLRETDLVDLASLETDHGFELRTRDRYRKLIYKIDSALGRIEEGSYGYCEETGKSIGLKRLEARPVATLCVEAQERRERKERMTR